MNRLHAAQKSPLILRIHDAATGDQKVVKSSMHLLDACLRSPKAGLRPIRSDLDLHQALVEIVHDRAIWIATVGLPKAPIGPLTHSHFPQ